MSELIENGEPVYDVDERLDLLSLPFLKKTAGIIESLIWEYENELNGAGGSCRMCTQIRRAVEDCRLDVSSTCLVCPWLVIADASCVSFGEYAEEELIPERIDQLKEWARLVDAAIERRGDYS